MAVSALLAGYLLTMAQPFPVHVFLVVYARVSVIGAAALALAVVALVRALHPVEPKAADAMPLIRSCSWCLMSSTSSDARAWRRSRAAPASRSGVGYGTTGAVNSQRLADSAMSAFAAIRWRSMAR